MRALVLIALLLLAGCEGQITPPPYVPDSGPSDGASADADSGDSDGGGLDAGTPDIGETAAG